MMKELLDVLPQVGRLDLICLRSEKRGTIVEVQEAQLDTENGLIGDHYQGKSGKRQVTLIQAEHLEAIGSILKKEIDPVLTRRNLVVSGINLLALKDKQFLIGDRVILEFTGHCHPCSRMEQNFGPGGYNAMRGHGGITARVLRAGTIRINDEVRYMRKND